MARDWESWFQTASQPASAAEEAKRDRTEECIREAIRASSEIPSSVQEQAEHSRESWEKMLSGLKDTVERRQASGPRKDVHRVGIRDPASADPRPKLTRADRVAGRAEPPIASGGRNELLVKVDRLLRWRRQLVARHLRYARRRPVRPPLECSSRLMFVDLPAESSCRCGSHGHSTSDSTATHGSLMGPYRAPGYEPATGAVPSR